MLFKWKRKEKGQARELGREVQRILKLLKALDGLPEEEGKAQYGEYVKRQRKIVLQLLTIPGDIEVAQMILAYLWDSFEYIEKGIGVEKLPSIPGQDYYINKLKSLDVVRCYNCLKDFKKAEKKCPNCGTSIEWLMP